jgi:UDPglucose 6-dehydrogenase
MASIEQHFGADLSGKTFALWGLAFKPETDDVREAPALEMIRAIVDKGGLINAYDPQAMTTASAELADKHRSSVNFVEDPYAAITGADALVIMTEWKMFRQPDFNLLSKLKEKIIFDGRNMYDPEHVKVHGLTYVGIGRSSGPVPTR